MKSVLAAWFILAHSQYPALCCNGDADTGDCRPVPCESINENDDGSYTWSGIKFPPSMVHPSFNTQCHVCEKALTDQLGNSSHFPHCIFIQEGA